MLGFGQRTGARPFSDRRLSDGLIGIVLVALLCSVVSSRSMVKPITAVISHLRKSESTGLLPEFEKELSPVREIRDLTAGFNRAGGKPLSVKRARACRSAYVGICRIPGGDALERP